VMIYIPWSNQFMLDSLKESSSHLIEVWISCRYLHDSYPSI
jgi:hypothetical protein